MFDVVDERPDSSSGTTAGRLDLDDIGAETGEGQPAILGLFVGEFDDAYAGQVATQRGFVEPHRHRAMR